MKEHPSLEVHNNVLKTGLRSRVVLLAAVLLCAGVQLLAQQSEADRKLYGDPDEDDITGELELMDDLIGRGEGEPWMAWTIPPRCY